MTSAISACRVGGSCSSILWTNSGISGFRYETHRPMEIARPVLRRPVEIPGRGSRHHVANKRTKVGDIDRETGLFAFEPHPMPVVPEPVADRVEEELGPGRPHRKRDLRKEINHQRQPSSGHLQFQRNVLFRWSDHPGRPDDGQGLGSLPWPVPIRTPIDSESSPAPMPTSTDAISPGRTEARAAGGSSKNCPNRQGTLLPAATRLHRAIRTRGWLRRTSRSGSGTGKRRAGSRVLAPPSAPSSLPLQRNQGAFTQNFVTPFRTSKLNSV